MNMTDNNNVNKIEDELFTRFPELSGERENFRHVYHIIENVFVKSKTLFLCGNGGSSSDCEHIAGELLKNFRKKRRHSPEMKERFRKVAGGDALLEKLEPGLRTISLLSHPGLMSAFGNDVDPVLGYAQQLYGLGREGDAVIGISTSGNAENIFQCFRAARAMGISTILLTGLNHGKCEEFADCIFRGNSLETYRIQEYHLPVYHALCRMLEERFFGDE